MGKYCLVREREATSIIPTLSPLSKIMTRQFFAFKTFGNCPETTKFAKVFTPLKMPTMHARANHTGRVTHQQMYCPRLMQGEQNFHSLLPSFCHLLLFGHLSSALFNETVVCTHQQIYYCHTANPRSREGGNEISHRKVLISK